MQLSRKVLKKAYIRTVKLRTPQIISFLSNHVMNKTYDVEGLPMYTPGVGV